MPPAQIVRTCRGELTVKQIAKITNRSPNTISRLIRERNVVDPIKYYLDRYNTLENNHGPKYVFDYNGVTYRGLKEFSEAHGVSYHQVTYRYGLGLRGDELLGPPKNKRRKNCITLAEAIKRTDFSRKEIESMLEEGKNPLVEHQEKLNKEKRLANLFRAPKKVNS